MRICDRLEKILDKEILRIEENPRSGMNNRTYIVRTDGGDYLYRWPCAGTELFSDRAGEARAYEVLKPYYITDVPVYLNAATGEKLTIFYPDSHTCDPEDRLDVAAALNLMRQLHGLEVDLQARESLWQRVLRFGQIAAEEGSNLLREERYVDCLRGLENFRGLLENLPQHPIHGDALAGNFLFPGKGNPVLIDLEFASMGCVYEDLADFCHDADYTPERSKTFLADYRQRRPEHAEVRCLFAHIAAVALMWSGWAAFKAEREPHMRPFFENYRDMSIRCAFTYFEHI